MDTVKACVLYVPRPKAPGHGKKEHCSTMAFDEFQRLELARRPNAGNMASHTVSAFAVPWYTARTSTNKPPVVGTPLLAPFVRPEAQGNEQGGITRR